MFFAPYAPSQQTLRRKGAISSENGESHSRLLAQPAACIGATLLAFRPSAGFWGASPARSLRRGSRKLSESGESSRRPAAPAETHIGATFPRSRPSGGVRPTPRLGPAGAKAGICPKAAEAHAIRHRHCWRASARRTPRRGRAPNAGPRRPFSPANAAMGFVQKRRNKSATRLPIRPCHTRDGHFSESDKQRSQPRIVLVEDRTIRRSNLKQRHHRTGRERSKGSGA